MNQICTNKEQSSRLLEAGVRPNTPCANVIQSKKQELNAKSITIKRTSLISVIIYWYMAMRNLVVNPIELNDYE